MNSSHMTESLLQRAVASAYLPRYGFIDRAAEVLVGQLAIGSKQLEHALNRVQRDASMLLRCQWIDEQVKRFFEEHPEGTVIEIDAGLSTRFHRLSYASEWPKFSWLNVDTGSDVQPVSGYFPVTDNYARIERTLNNQQWLRELSELKPGPYFFIFENLSWGEGADAFEQLCQPIANCVGLMADLH